MKVQFWRRATSMPSKFLRKLSLNTSGNRSKHFDEVSHAIKSAGYRGESFKTKTDDGYILTIHRILPTKHSDFKGPAFLMHGLYRNSYDYIATGPKIALAYYLADHGYDVWMGNARGSRYSMEHERHHHESKDFWKFSFHEIGLFDVSAMLDFMLDQTKEAKAFYVGHSQGACSLLALLSSEPRYNDMISQGHLLAPAVFLNYSPSPILTMPAKRLQAVMKYSNRIDRVNVALLLRLSHKLCNYNAYNPDTAMKLYKSITCSIIGRNSKQVEIAEEALRTFYTSWSDSASMMQLVHFFQLHSSGKFCQFDFKEDNIRRYNLSDPPEYELRNVTAPMYLYCGTEDALTAPKGVEKLASKLPNVKRYESVFDWNHMDVLLGRNSRKVLYKNIMKSMSSVH